jgi:hypothetical protein
MNAALLRVVGSAPDLAALAEIANEEHKQSVRAAQTVLDHARRAGDALLAAKAALPHGQFMSWVKKNCRFSYRTAANYMALAAKWSVFKIASPATLAEALNEIAMTRVVKPHLGEVLGDPLTANERQPLLFPESELPVSPRAALMYRDKILAEIEHEYRCPHCAHEWSGERRPPLKGKLASVPAKWRSQVPKEAAKNPGFGPAPE